MHRVTLFEHDTAGPRVRVRVTLGPRIPFSDVEVMPPEPEHEGLPPGDYEVIP